MIKPPTRLPSETYDLTLRVGDGVHNLAVSFVRDPRTGAVVELIFVERGKIGHGLDNMLRDLGVQISRLLQGRAAQAEDAKNPGAP